MPIIVRNQYLLWAHMQRLHHLMTPELRASLDELLKQVEKVTASMIEIGLFANAFVVEYLQNGT